MPLALSTGHQVGLAVTAAVFIAFALASSFLFPRVRPNYPAGALPAFIVVAILLFFGMLAAVEVFGVEETHESQRAAETLTETEPPVPPTTTAAQPTTTVATTTQATTTTTETKATTVKVTETEFKISLPSTRLPAGRITFDVENAGQIPHDLAIKGMKEQTKLIPAGGSAVLTVTLKPGTYELWCTVPGHVEAGMKLNITVT